MHTISLYIYTYKHIEIKIEFKEMAGKCISSCVEDARVPVRATYVSLYKWPESDFEFVRSMSSRHETQHSAPRVVDSISCRQMYLRSYTFSREEDYRDEKTVKCLGLMRGRDKNKHAFKNKKSGGRTNLKKAKPASCSVLASIFRRLLSCTTEIDVANWYIYLLFPSLAAFILFLLLSF